MRGVFSVPNRDFPPDLSRRSWRDWLKLLRFIYKNIFIYLERKREGINVIFFIFVFPDVCVQKSEMSRPADVSHRTLLLLDEVSRKRGLFEREEPRQVSSGSPVASRQVNTVYNYKILTSLTSDVWNFFHILPLKTRISGVWLQECLRESTSGWTRTVQVDLSSVSVWVSISCTVAEWHKGAARLVCCGGKIKIYILY